MSILNLRFISIALLTLSLSTQFCGPRRTGLPVDELAVVAHSPDAKFYETMVYDFIMGVAREQYSRTQRKWQGFRDVSDISCFAGQAWFCRPDDRSTGPRRTLPMLRPQDKEISHGVGLSRAWLRRESTLSVGGQSGALPHLGRHSEHRLPANPPRSRSQEIRHDWTVWRWDSHCLHLCLGRTGQGFHAHLLHYESLLADGEPSYG